MCNSEVFSISKCGQRKIEQLSRDGSHSSHSAGIPSLGAISNGRVQLGMFIISPSDRLYRAWADFLASLVYYIAWASPFEFGFLEKPEAPLSIIDNVVNAFFAVDIVVTFFVAYRDQDTNLVKNPKQIAWKYTRSWLAFDVISTIPSELALKILPSSFLSYGLFNMLRLWRLRRVTAIFSRLEEARSFNNFWVRLAKLICVTLFAVHCAGCFYYLLGAKYHDPKRTWIGASMEDFHEQILWIRYVTSIYWSTTNITSVGSGNFHAQNAGEMIFEILFMFFIIGLSAYLLGNLTKLFCADAQVNAARATEGDGDARANVDRATEGGGDVALENRENGYTVLNVDEGIPSDGRAIAAQATEGDRDVPLEDRANGYTVIELASVRMLPWARANLNPTAQALIIFTVAGAAYFIVTDKNILASARQNSFNQGNISH